MKADKLTIVLFVVFSFSAVMAATVLDASLQRKRIMAKVGESRDEAPRTHDLTDAQRTTAADSGFTLCGGSWVDANAVTGIKPVVRGGEAAGVTLAMGGDGGVYLEGVTLGEAIDALYGDAGGE